MRFFILSIFFCGVSKIATAKAFNLNQLPLGAEITIPYPATTYIPLNSRATISATDSPQSAKMTSLSLSKSKQAIAIKLAIYDRNSERVKYVTIQPNMPYIYSFSGVSSVLIIPKAQTPAQHSSSIVLQIESDKSLKIAK